MPDSSDGRQRALTEDELAALERALRTDIEEVPTSTAGHAGNCLRCQYHPDEFCLTAAALHVLPALLAEVRQARLLLSSPRWSGVITSVDDKGLPATRIGAAGHSVPAAPVTLSMWPGRRPINPDPEQWTLVQHSYETPPPGQSPDEVHRDETGTVTALVWRGRRDRAASAMLAALELALWLLPDEHNDAREPVVKAIAAARAAGIEPGP